MANCTKCEKLGHEEDQAGAGMGQHRIIFVHDDGTTPCLLRTVWPVPKVPPLSEQGKKGGKA